MALTFRTGSGGKGSALTIEELDNNFRHFTGSHSITGSLIISSSLIVSGSIGISGSIIPSQASSTLGTADNPWGDLFVSDSSIIFVSGSTTSSFGVDSSGSLSGSFAGAIDGTEFYINNLPTTEPSESGRLWLSGSFSNSKYLMVRD